MGAHPSNRLCFHPSDRVAANLAMLVVGWLAVFMADQKSAVVFSVVTTKGGDGKPTVAAHLASVWHKAGHRVLLVDIDKGGASSSTKLAKVMRKQGHSFPPVTTLDGELLATDLRRVANGFDIIIVDGTPGVSRSTLEAMRVADFVLIPVTPGVFSIWEVPEVAQLLEHARASRPSNRPVRAAVLFNKYMSQPVATRKTIKALAKQGIPVLRTKIHLRPTYMKQAIVFNGSPRSEAAREMIALAREVFERLANDNQTTTGSNDEQKQRAAS